MSIGDPPAVFDTGTGLGLRSFFGVGNTVHTAGFDLLANEDFIKLRDRISRIEQRLLILEPNTELQEKFPALQEAYDHYKVIEKLVNQNKQK